MKDVKPPKPVLHLKLVKASNSPQVSERDLALRSQLAEMLFRERRIRDNFLSSDVLSEASWDILLKLAARPASSPPVSVRQACEAMTCSLPAAMRWLSYLEEVGLIERRFDLVNQRCQVLSLTELGWGSMQGYLDAIYVDRKQMLTDTL